MRALRKRVGVKSWEIEGEAVLYDPDSGMGHVLNSTALRIWALCDSRNTTADIERALVADYPEQQTTIRHDVDMAVRQLANLGLIENI